MTESRKEMLRLYLRAEKSVWEAGYGAEIELFKKRACDHGFSEPDLLREAAWVILCAGFRESVVRKIFDMVSICFCDWESAEEIMARREECVWASLEVFRNKRKIGSVIGVVERIASQGFEHMRERILFDPVTELAKLPGIGTTTAHHLARNLGFACAKNDRHLMRLGQAYGFECASDLCAAVAEISEERVGVVDVVLWRYCVLSQRVAGADERSRLRFRHRLSGSVGAASTEPV